MKNRLIYILCLLTLVATSCNKFLDLNPKSEVINEDMFATTKGCEDALIAIYSQLGEEQLYGKDMLWAVPEVLAQNFRYIEGSGSIFTAITEYRYNDAKSTIDDMWLKTYEVISWINNAIINIEPKSEADYPMKSLYLGELYGMRAFLHLDMARLFAPHVERNGSSTGIPYVTTYSYEATEFSTVSETYDMIVADLLKAQELLAEDVEYVAFPREIAEDDDNYDEWTASANFIKHRETHMNIYAVTATLARAYWTMGEYAKAKVEAEKVINSGKFPLASRDRVPTMLGGALSITETIFGVYSTRFYETMKKYLADYRMDSFRVYSDNQAAYDSYLDVYSKDLSTNASFDVRQNWFSMVLGNDDPEFNGCMKMVDKERFNNEEVGLSDAFKPIDPLAVEGFSILRIPEMYYISADGYLKEGNTALAEERINTVINSRGLTKLSERVPAITLTEEVIYNERWKEYFGEGVRWFDMKKKGMEVRSNAEGIIHPATNAIYVLPIPEGEFSAR